ncbi:unnamed protein product [Paramecium octaurelia]|uniref:Uncharacterized protein n=1 Tax=Paramecium octaurelia TaxID=43137 RepID=A0A8S1V075_PAROT|nr:unnamed protein product [Paramecium octaurelia]
MVARLFSQYSYLNQIEEDIQHQNEEFQYNQPRIS